MVSVRPKPVQTWHPPEATHPPVDREEDGLGLLAFRLHEVMQAGVTFDQVEDAARRQLERFGLRQRARAVDVDSEERTGVPGAVQDAARFFKDNVEESGWGQVQVLELQVGPRLDDVYVVHARTFGGDGYLEVYDAGGAPLASGTTEHSRIELWDDEFGSVRDVAAYLAG